MLDSKKNFIKKCQENLNIAQSVRQRDKASISLKDNRELIVHEFEKYDTSFLNPTYLHALQIPQPGLMSVVYDMFLRTTSLALLNRPIFVWEKNMLLLKIEEFFDYGDLDALISSLGEINLKIMESRIEHNVIESVNSNNIFTEILMEANDTHFDWLARYGKAISRKDIHMAKHWFALSDKELQRIAKHIADAFFHGFISQSRQIAGRSNVRLLYSIGQEAIAKQVFQEFMERGISPIPLEPQSTSIPYVYELDHRFDEMLNNYVSSQDMLNQFYENSMQKYQQSVENICGFVRVSSFGREAKASRSQYAFEPPQKMRDAYQQYQSHVRDVESRILRPDRLSFCSVAFPDIDIGKDFSDIFEEFMHINTEDSAHYEEIQQQLIDILDTCDSVHIQGLGLNKTDIHICFRKELDAKTQSNFLNCGGDLNIPYGEVFTTPSLTGTEGVYFVNEIFIQNNYYKNLYLKFRDGRIVDYGCTNFSEQECNKKYVKDHLLQGYEEIAMGEFAIGSNTRVYRVAKKYNIFSKLPILIAEKMGPHIAIGDPCFARGEDSPVYNMYNQKEMIARENEITCNRLINRHCYFNVHIDITLPFDEIKELAGYKNGERICIIIQNGKFVPSFAEELNQNME